MFLSELKAGPASDPGHDFWFTPVAGGGRTISGAYVSGDTAMRLSTVYKCIRVCAETLSMLPLHMYRRKPRGRERVTENKVADLLAVRPNRWQTPMQFRGMLEAHRSLRGNGYAEIFWSNGEPDELIPLHPDRVTPEVAENGMPRYRVRALNGAGERTLVPGEILHISGLTMDGYRGLNPIEAQREAVGSAIASRDYGARFWDNDARPPYWIEIPGQFKNLEVGASFREEWQVLYGGSNRGKPATLDRGMKLHELGLSNEDAQWIDSRKYSDVDLCGLWRVPPHKIGILDRATWGNIEHQNIEFVTDCLLPLAVSWEQAIWRDLIVDSELYVSHLLEQLLRGDTQTRFAAYGAAIKDGWITRNEVRELENRNPLPGLDEPLQPLNMTPVGQLTIPAGRGGPSPTRAVALLAANAERVYRKEVAQIARVKAEQTLHQVFEGHAKFVAEVMAIGNEKAQTYVDRTIAACAEFIARGGNPAAIDSPEWKSQQLAALLRLED
jgi:HK97 family phage portal protein